MRNARNWVFALVAATVTANALAGCTSTPTPPDTNPATSGSPSPASVATGTRPSANTPESASQQAVDAYIALQNAFSAASRMGDPSYPDLAKYGTGDALALYTDALNASKVKGLLGRGQAIFHPRVTALSPPVAPTKVSIEDCMDTSATSQYKANGDPYQDTPGGRRLVFAEVEFHDGTWKVFSLAVRGVGSCTG
ncbi:hypothetical protein Rhe02_81180 [Rhizocola hellebori]|uniref:Uncharacterized protein n=1 Tax=Rhizocola hellebori TaxID=1392758 RepID=A0A8J3QGD1_9ACTN|nr:hypothetical protein [Rhizocola hellebori]GIH10051.1 hypothetical protein Rhe02_81180 [Rhizocola hellebori]